MKSRNITAVITLFILFVSGLSFAQIGEAFIHDPSTLMECDGKYYTYGTGENGIYSEDGWTWHTGAIRPNRGLAPDAIQIGDRYLVSYTSKGGGMSGGHAGAINTMWTNSLDPNSPDFGFYDNSIVASTDGVEDCDAIDPAFLLDPTDGRLWLTYGTYFGFIRLVELNPTNGKRMPGNKSIDIAIDCEATAMMYRDGWYYLLATHGTCCDGPNSTYSIQLGRSRSVKGPYLDNVGRDMLKGGGKFFTGSRGNLFGAGHFGLIELEDGIEKYSIHYEADLERSGLSVLSIQPLLWRDGWPLAGENVTEGIYEIKSERSGFALELAVDFKRLTEGIQRHWGRDPNAPIVPVAPIKLEDVINEWPTGNIEARLGDYMVRPNQLWQITPLPDSGGYFGSPFFKITIAGTERTLTATADAEVTTLPNFTGAPEQMWQIDQLTDGTYRIMPVSVPGTDERLALIAIGDSTPTLAKFDPKSDNSKWTFHTP